jgi:hypothetical protein
MTTAITRYQVSEALRVTGFPVPDFITREKTSLAWSKVYISIQNGRLRFIRLNLFQRIIRYFIGCCCYPDTIIREKPVMEQVKQRVHSIKTAGHVSITTDDLSAKVQTASDFRCLSNMLGGCLDVLKFEDGGFSEDFLSTAIELARQNLKKNSEDKTWESITEVFLFIPRSNPDNEELLREALGLPHRLDLPSQCIKVDDEIKKVVMGRLEKVKNTLEKLLQIGDYLKILDLLEKIDQDKELSEVLRPFCIKMGQDLGQALIDSGVHPSIVEAYLNDQTQIVHRLFYHLDLGFVNPVLSNRGESRRHYIDLAMKKLLERPLVISECEIEGRPIITLRPEEGRWRWVNGINLGLDGEPVILNEEKNDEASF